MKTFIQSARAHLGGMAMGLGVIGLFLFALALVVTIFCAGIFGSASFEEGPRPTAAIHPVADVIFMWTIVNRLAPVFVISLVLIGYGFYEALNEKKMKS